MKSSSLQVAILISCGILLAQGSTESPVVTFSAGSVRGSLMQSSQGRTFMSFRRIPYAKPPVDQLRFSDPVESEPWTGILDGTKEGPTCLQYLSVAMGTEDCLYLNVYTHEIGESASKRPVMVWIHGGAFYMGSGNGETDLVGPGHLLNTDIVLVTLNYRLGILGFLSTEDEVAPGNYGLLDQAMALRWVKKHIAAFGGDPESITIFGESAGGASVEYQLLSPRNEQGVFHRAIAQSGSALCSWAHTETVRQYTDQLAVHLGCPTASSKDLVNCLRTKDGKEITEFRKTIQSISFLPVGFGPRVDKERKDPFLPRSPVEMLESGQFHQVPFISGINQNEAAFIVSTMLAENGKEMKQLEEDLPSGLALVLDLPTQSDTKEKSLQALKQYLGEQLPWQNLQALEELMSDRLFGKCCHDSILLHARHSRAPTYAYLYTHRGAVSLSDITGAGSDDFGVSHADELFLLFTGYLSRTLQNDDDRRTSQILVDFWTSFAEKGVPSSSVSKSQWLPVSDSMKYLNINVDPTLVEADFPFSERLSFWDRLLPKGSSEKKPVTKHEL